MSLNHAHAPKSWPRSRLEDKFGMIYLQRWDELTFTLLMRWGKLAACGCVSISFTKVFVLMKISWVLRLLSVVEVGRSPGISLKKKKFKQSLTTWLEGVHRSQFCVLGAHGPWYSLSWVCLIDFVVCWAQINV